VEIHSSTISRIVNAQDIGHARLFLNSRVRTTMAMVIRWVSGSGVSLLRWVSLILGL